MIDRNNPLPLYEQLKLALLTRIRSEDLTPGEALPSEVALGERYGVSRITVRQALRALADEGFISRQQGRGTFVLPQKLEYRISQLGAMHSDLKAQGIESSVKVLEYETVPAPHKAAQKLEVNEGFSLLFIRRLLLIDNEPIAILSGYYNFGEGITITRQELEETPLFRLLESKYGISLHRFSVNIEATLPWDEEIELLGITPGIPMLLLETLVWDQEGRPIILLKNSYRGDRYKHNYQVE